MICTRFKHTPLPWTCVDVINQGPWGLFWLFDPCPICSAKLHHYWTN